VLALLASAGADAEPADDTADPEEIETLVVTASQSPQPASLLPGSVEVLTGEALQGARYDGILEALRHRPGLHADQPGGRGSRGSVYTRGLDPNHTKVLIDGIALNDPMNARGGSFDFSTLDNLDAIERIEIVRGPTSAVQGADAIAGALQVVTRDGKGPDALRLGVAAGRYGYLRGYASAHGERGPFDLAVAGSYVNEGQPEENGDYRGGTFYGALGADLPAQARLRGTLLFHDSASEAFPEFSGGPELAAIRAFEERDVRAAAAGLALTQAPLDWLDYALTGSVYQLREERRSPGVAPAPGDPQFFVPAEPDTNSRLRRATAALRGTARAPGGFDFTLGGDVTFEGGTSDGALLTPFAPFQPIRSIDFDLDRSIGGPFGELHWSCDCGAVVLAGIRADFTDREDAVVTPRISGSYSIAEPLQVRASWGEGFKLPSFFALGGSVVSNPTLAAEHSRGWDVGLRYAHTEERLAASVTYFEIQVRDLIDFDPRSFRLENLGEVRSRGVELEASAMPLPSLELSGHATFAEPLDTETREPLLNRPRWRGGLALRWQPIEPVSLRIEALFVGSALDVSVPTGRTERIPLDAYARVDLALSWSPRDWLEIHLAVDNLLDAEYREAIGYPAPGIRPRAGVELRL
jgi:iron complex outermembrane receptor protein/vitamin B12 transporter